MPERLLHFKICCFRIAVCLGVCFLASSLAVGQANVNATVPADQAPDKQNKITVRGCLSSRAQEHFLAVATSGGYFLLTGQTSGLENYIDREISLQGSKGDPIPLDGYNNPFPSFEVSKLVEVFPKQESELHASFTNRAAWKAETIEKYGVKFARPENMYGVQEPNPNLAPNFGTNEDAETVSSFGIPREVYANANLRGGSFTIFVNRKITNRASCMQFGQLGPREEPPMPYVVGDLSFSEATGGGGGMGTYYGDYYFHIFQHGLCFELAFELVTYNPHNADTGCNIPMLSEEDDLNVIRPLVASVSFFRPTVVTSPEMNSHGVPRVTEFTASAQTADGVSNRGLITFSWSTQATDYVEFTYTCGDPSEAEHGGVWSVVISENGPNRYCQNTASFETYSAGHFYRSPNSSTDIGFGFFNHEDPTSVIVTITPFSHGEAYPASSKSLAVIVNPYNPFQGGVPTETRNMTVAYAPGTEGTQSYRQGSLFTILWTDTRTQDPCVNLYLVQDNQSGGENFLLQINGKLEIGCLKPANSGSYTWTVTSKHFGSGFRILAGTPGGTSGTLGAPFNIVRTDPNSLRKYIGGPQLLTR